MTAVGGGAEINFGGAREVYFVGIREGHGGTRNLSQSGSNEQSEEQRLKGIFRPNSEIQAVFPAEDRRSTKKKGLPPRNVVKSGVSPQKTPIWASICTPIAPSLLISSGHSPRLRGHNFRLGGTSSHLGRHGPGMPPRGAGSAFTQYLVFMSVCDTLELHQFVQHGG